ncbi:hypothetical protein K493DRAFT_311822 [Basidiobolus meristosporus CBS 931.73]|uniref:Protein SCAI n=1 Tax=Basidiobolus meristosporus CBS 931.73 TaxID=1314790 RepID=A0A1Y1YZS4_9FUNG|nr:hypothetical protein K493DRAFT_311822 [Basidiobolus meristosporus CBS 931.73]|eukprot:ORY03197.1 hypothetical protein K493DRAFT_311822 [Basidiobolus meristosporus CBS 931.73]
MEDVSNNSAAGLNNVAHDTKLDESVDDMNANKEGEQSINPAHQRIVEEFQYLLEKSQQLFAGLRELSPTGGRQWQPYFQRTFEIYTKLWKFQQQHRAVLENKDNYGLKRWEVGEVASKIGQLYYHYYLRTSETNYLQESYVFYEAIRERAYFKDVLDSKNPALMIKKLRYYARFIVVCLLLNKRASVRKLLSELTVFVEDYAKTFKSSDSSEWQLVLQEISTFLEAEKHLIPVTPEGAALPFSNRLGLEKVSRSEKDGPKMKLQEAILVGNCQNQIKFSELTLDMYRMLQSLEREPVGSKTMANTEGSGNADKSHHREEGSLEDQVNAPPSSSNDKSTARRVNPHKFLLYRPNYSQLVVYLANAFKEINDNSALLLYLSADGVKVEPSANNSYSGGVATAHRKVSEKSEASDVNALTHCLHPEDILPFTRKPLFLIVDSNNSQAFKNIWTPFNQPFMCLLSPAECPIKDIAQVGNLFTLFLHSPLLGFSFVSQLTQITASDWAKCTDIVSALEDEIGELLLSAQLDKATKFLQDDFLRRFVTRFVFCYAVLTCHNSFNEPTHFPTASPAIPEEILSSPKVMQAIKELVSLTNSQSHYNFPKEPTSEVMDQS